MTKLIIMLIPVCLQVLRRIHGREMRHARSSIHST